MIVFIVLFQFVFAIIAYKIMSSQKELVWKSDINDYQLVSFKRGKNAVQCIGFHFLCFP